MSTIYRDNRRTADAFVSAGPVAGELHGAGAYLTNGVFLYRVVGFVGGAADRMVELEDCYWLDVVRVPVTQLHACQLRVVRPAPDER